MEEIKRKRGRWSEIAHELYDIKAQLTELNRANKQLTTELKMLSDGCSSKDGHYLFKKEIRPGKINWDFLCELEKIDKEEYRKEDEERWTLIKLT